MPINVSNIGGILAKGFFGGLGLAASEELGNVFAQGAGGPNVSGAAGNVAVGAAIEYFDDDLGLNIDIMGINAAEYFGVGVQSAGWREGFDVIGVPGIGSPQGEVTVEEELPDQQNSPTPTVGGY